MSEYTDELFEREPDPEALRRGAAIYERETGINPYSYLAGNKSPRVESGRNEHHGLFFRIRQDEALYQCGYITAAQCHRDAEPGRTVDPVEVARAALSYNGSTSLPDIHERGQIISRATPVQGQSDFTSWIVSTGNRVMTIGFNGSSEIYRNFVSHHETENFKTVTIARMSTLGNLTETPENAEIEYGTITDAGSETAAVTAHSKTFSISRQALISGEMRRILSPFAAVGRDAARAEGDKVFNNILLGNPAMSDSELLFSSAHANDGTAGVPSTTTLDELRALMAAQVGAANEAINVRPFYIVGPAVYESSFAALRQAANTQDPTGQQSTSHVVTLTDSRLSGQTAWFAIADPKIHESIAIITLTDSREPFLERLTRAPSNAPDGLSLRLTHDFVVTPVDWRPIARNAGS